MDEALEVIKPQFINILRDKRYNINFLELEDLGNNVLKIYYNKKFIKLKIFLTLIFISPLFLSIKSWELKIKFFNT